MSVSHHVLIHFQLTAVAPVRERETLPGPMLILTFPQCIHSLLTCHRERAEKKHTQAITKMVKKQSAVHLHLGTGYCFLQ